MDRHLMTDAERPPRTLRVAIAGFGTVGRAVAKIIGERSPEGLVLTHIYNRGISRKVVDWVPPNVRWTDRLDDLLGEDVDVVVELMGGTTTAEDLIRRALLAGKAVVTANKQVIARSGPELMDLAARQRRQFRFEAAVAAGIPIIRSVEEGLAADSLSRVIGVLNGTCNYILTRMETASTSFAKALAEAQALGFAEADPTDDLDGLDARAKLAVLAMVGLQCRVRPDEIPCRSIASVEASDIIYARRLNCSIRQVSWAEKSSPEDGSIVAAVGPALVPLMSPLAQVQGANNLVTVHGRFGGDTTFAGPGAGGDPTAVAVVSDLLATARTGGLASGARASWPLTSVRRDFFAKRYLRFTVFDRPGIIAAISGALARHELNIDAVLQEPGCPTSRLPFVMTLDACGGPRLESALEEIEAFDFHVAPLLHLPVLEPTELRAGPPSSGAEGQGRGTEGEPGASEFVHRSVTGPTADAT
jgi:homoserine dehydrogenase